ncbi:MAG: hypothetical protein INH41_05685, partial [Myxococcaceae bacterium]|nr:hypothetical protein [Myxococcaceae bacterium]
DVEPSPLPGAAEAPLPEVSAVLEFESGNLSADVEPSPLPGAAEAPLPEVSAVLEFEPAPLGARSESSSNWLTSVAERSLPPEEVRVEAFTPEEQSAAAPSYAIGPDVRVQAGAGTSRSVGAELSAAESAFDDMPLLDAVADPILQVEAVEPAPELHAEVFAASPGAPLEEEAPGSPTEPRAFGAVPLPPTAALLAAPPSPATTQVFGARSTARPSRSGGTEIFASNWGTESSTPEAVAPARAAPEALSVSPAKPVAIPTTTQVYGAPKAPAPAAGAAPLASASTTQMFGARPVPAPAAAEALSVSPAKPVAIPTTTQVYGAPKAPAPAAGAAPPAAASTTQMFGARPVPAPAALSVSPSMPVAMQTTAQVYGAPKALAPAAGAAPPATASTTQMFGARSVPAPAAAEALPVTPTAIPSTTQVFGARKLPAPVAEAMPPTAASTTQVFGARQAPATVAIEALPVTPMAISATTQVFGARKPPSGAVTPPAASTTQVFGASQASAPVAIEALPRSPAMPVANPTTTQVFGAQKLPAPAVSKAPAGEALPRTREPAVSALARTEAFAVTWDGPSGLEPSLGERFEVESGPAASLATGMIGQTGPSIDEGRLELSSNADFLDSKALTDTGEAWQRTGASIDLPPDDGEGLIVQGIVIDDEPAPGGAPSVDRRPVRVIPGEHRVILHTVEAQVKRGLLRNPDLAGATLSLEAPGGASEAVAVSRVRAIFFMLAPGAQAPAADGDKVRITFNDGRQLVGYSSDHGQKDLGFFVVPVDNRTNTERIFIFRHGVESVRIDA